MSQLDKEMEAAVNYEDEPKVVLNGVEYPQADMTPQQSYLYEQTMNLIGRRDKIGEAISDHQFTLDQILVALEGMQSKLQTALETPEQPPEVTLPEDKVGL
jgi:hypothetical protein|tara:strand:- start:89 stop:391 length:303 start_codon:yes stop_codon:yes gene_type:complete